MSLFSDDDAENIKSAITFFNSLTQEDKTKIVADLRYAENNKRFLDNLLPLFAAVQNDIANYDPTTMSQKLFAYGMEQVFATLFVDAMIKQSPTTEYEMSVLSKIEDKHFVEMIPKLMNDVWIEQLDLPHISEKYQITEQTLGVFVSLSRKFLSGLARRRFSENKIRGLCESKGFSEAKTDALINVLKIHSKSWFDNLVFSNTQDAFFEINTLKQQNVVILNTLKEILSILKQYQKPSDSTHFQ